MDLLKKYWPLGLKAKKGDIVSLIIWIVVSIIVCGLISTVCLTVLGAIPVINILSGIVALIFDIYGIVNIVVCVLSFLGKI